MQGRLKDPEGSVLLTIRKHNQYIIGREQVPDENHLNLDDPYVSRRHAVITCEKEFCYEDAGSRNGSRINDVILPAGEKAFLRDGDRITVGRTDLVFRIRKGQSAVRLPQGVQMRLSEMPGGCMIRIQTAERNHLQYAQRMLENNPDPALPVPEHTDMEEGDRFEYSLREAVSLRKYFEQERTAGEYRMVLEKTLHKILASAGLLLDEKEFLMDPGTVFITDPGDIRLLYLPFAGLSQEGFRAGLMEILSFLEDRCPSDFRTVLQKMKERLREGGGCWDCYKVLHSTRDAGSVKPVPKIQKEKKPAGRQIPAGTALMVASFAVFMAVYWFADLSVTNLCGVGLILAGFNVLASGLKRK